MRHPGVLFNYPCNCATMSSLMGASSAPRMYLFGIWEAGRLSVILADCIFAPHAWNMIDHWTNSVFPLFLLEDFGSGHELVEEVSKWSPQGWWLLYGVWLGRICPAPAQSSKPHTTDLLFLRICCWGTCTLPSAEPPPYQGLVLSCCAAHCQISLTKGMRWAPRVYEPFR